MNILILGATGQIGGYLFKRFSSLGNVSVTGTTRKIITGLKSFNPFLDDWIGMEKFDVIINCIGQFYKRETTFETSHIGISQHILNYVKNRKNIRIIQISALGAALHHPSKFLSTKAEADAMILTHPNSVVLRPSIVCTPSTNLVGKLKKLKNLSKYTAGILPVPSGFRNSKIQPVLPEDLFDVTYRLCKEDSLKGIINITGKDIFTYEELIRKVCHDRKIKFADLNAGFFKALFKVLPDFLTKNLLTEEELKLINEDNTFDCSVAENIIKREVQHTKQFWEKELS